MSIDLTLGDSKSQESIRNSHTWNMVVQLLLVALDSIILYTLT